MQIFKDLQTKQGQAEFKADLTAKTAKIIAEIRANKAAHGGLSKTQRNSHAPGYPQRLDVQTAVAGAL